MLILIVLPILKVINWDYIFLILWRIISLPEIWFLLASLVDSSTPTSFLVNNQTELFCDAQVKDSILPVEKC